MTLHRGVHPDLDVPDCFGCRIASVMVAPSATPTRNGGDFAAENVAKEKRWHRDHDAYRRLAKNGLVPHTIDGAAHLEHHAKTAVEVEHGLNAPSWLGDTDAA